MFWKLFEIKEKVEREGGSELISVQQRRWWNFSIVERKSVEEERDLSSMGFGGYEVFFFVFYSKEIVV